MKADHRMAVATAPKRNSKHWQQGTVTWAELVEWATNPADRKEAGNYLLGTLLPDTTVVHPGQSEPCGPNLHRRKDFVVSRSAITLDVDTPELGFADKVELLFPYAGLLHTTYSSSPDEPRYRLIIPTDRELLPDEYIVAAESVMQQLGLESFDPGTTQPERYMFKPAAKQADWYTFTELVGDLAPVEQLLADFDDDLSEKPTPRPHRNKRNPFELDGVVGAFNRAYEDLALLVETYELPYENVSEDRWQLVGARAVAGFGPIADTEGLYFSHHANDPAFNRTCTSFDLVRLHRFGELDENVEAGTPINRLPSHKAMADLATVDHRVTAELVGADFDGDLTDVAHEEHWRLGLRINRQGHPLDVISNWDLWAENDRAFRVLYYNEITLAIEVNGDLPWRTVQKGGPTFTSTDRKELLAYMEREYSGFRATRARLDDAVDTIATRRRQNPILDYLESLTWDRTPRLDTCLPGVEPTKFTRMVARKCMTAAVARMYEPGCKWDHTLVLYGPEGLGKSWWVEKVARGYMNTLGSINHKDTLLTMQRSWIMLSDEGQSLRKADSEAQKEFLTKTEDAIRMPYDRETLIHKRHCVIWSTTNDETFLRRQEGNRRFLIVHCESKVDFESLTEEYIDQLWAEAVYRYKAGEKLFLSDTESVDAAAERERFIEEDALGGIIDEYLETLVPEDWDERSPDSRRSWLVARADGFEAAGTEPITQVCSMQVWVEALGRRAGEHRRVDLLDITNALKRLPGWESVPGRSRLPGYGPQAVFRRVDPEVGALLDDLL